MKILFYYQSISLGGQQSQTLSLCREFSKLGHECFYAYENGTDLLSDIQSTGTAVKIKTIGKNLRGRRTLLVRTVLLFFNSFFRLIWARKILKEHNIDLIITSTSYGSLILGLGSINMSVQRFRLIGDDLEKYEHPWFGLYKVLKIDRFVDKYFGFPLADKQLQKKGVSESKFAEYQNDGVDISNFFPQSEDKIKNTQKRLGILYNEFVIGWIGRIDEKVHVGNTLIYAAEIKKRGFTNFKLLVVGGGKADINGNYDEIYPNLLRDQAKDLGILEQTIFTGWVPFSAVPDYLNVMDIVPLLESDPKGGSLLREAMACGKVALSVDGLSRTQRSFMTEANSVLVGPKGYFNSAAEATIELFNSPEKIKDIGVKARISAEEEFSFTAQAKSILKYVEST